MGREAQGAAPWGWVSSAYKPGSGPHLGLLPELLAVNPLHLHSGISLLIGGALQGSRGPE